MKKFRREWIQRAAALGLLGPAGISGLVQEALAKGDLPAIAGVNTLTGTISVNGQPGKVGTPVNPGDTVATGGERGMIAVIVIAKDAYLLRESTTVKFVGSSRDPSLLETVALTTGKILSVFAKRPADQRVGVRARSATIGIRGTGCYVEAYERRTYFCLCYGEATIEAPGMPARKVVAKHHDDPMWLNEGEGNSGMQIEKTKFGSHTDDELILLEKLVGREPPFVALGLTGKYAN
jgi:hypothetical protein